MGSNQSCPSNSQKHDRQSKADSADTSRRRKSSVLLRGCKTDDEHKVKKKMMIEMLHALKGEEGLIASGLEYRTVTLGDDGELAAPANEAMAIPISQQILLHPSSAAEIDATYEYHNSDNEEEKKEENPKSCLPSRPSEGRCRTRENGRQDTFSHNYIKMTRLFHKDSNTMITVNNRKEFIADGAMYDIVCRLAMEYSQEVMIRDGQLQWVTIPEDDVVDDTNQLSTEPLQALVSTRLVEDESKLDNEPTLLLVTGKGHVRAGVFSRQHLLTSGLECGSAVQFVHEAHKRKMNLVILDPNARGDRHGMAIFEKSMAHLFGRWEKEEESLPFALKRRQQNLYLLSHSQSGAQFVRYLLKKSEFYLPRIGAIAFTDSTHNIQWTKRNNLAALRNLLESDKSIYFKRSSENIDFILNPLPSIGKIVDTDEFWKHRFGTIKTLCAGTSEHSLTNWFARYYILDYFDRHLAASNCTNQGS